MSLEYYEIRCDYCGTKVCDTNQELIDDSLGGLLSRFLEKAQSDNLCCYHGECMVEKNYEINKVKTVKERENLDNP